MDAIDWVAIVGAAAWTPQIITWISRALTKPKVSLHLHRIPQIGFTTLGPIFNVNLALLSEKKDVVFNKLSVKIKHESGGTYNFDWDGLSESVSEIESPAGLPISVKKVLLPLVVKVSHASVAQAFVRFQHTQFKKNNVEAWKPLLDEYAFLRNSGQLNTVENIEALTDKKGFNDIIQFFNSEFIWAAGKYTAVFELHSPNDFKYKKDEYTFTLTQDDVDILRANINGIKLELIESAKVENITDYVRKSAGFMWRYPELAKKETLSVLT